MSSSKGKPTDPKLREEAKKEVMQMEKGGGKGQWTTYNSAEMAKKYEAKGGEYEDKCDNPNQLEKGKLKPKEVVEKGERKDPDAAVGDKPKSSDKPRSKGKKEDEKEEEDEDKKRKADKDDDGKKADDDKKQKKETNGKAAPKAEKVQKPTTPGTRSQPSRGAKKSS